MQIEVLFPEICSLFGDMANIRYLSKCLPDAEIVYTQNREVPFFVNNNVDFIYMGSMSEMAMDIVIKTLLPYKERLKELIDNGTVMLFTGNSMGILGNYISDEDKIINSLGLFDFNTERKMNSRHNSMFLGKYNNIDIVGCRSQFDFYRNVKGKFISVTKGIGNNYDDNNEGLKYNNLFCTALLGPFLIQNPYFTKELLRILDVDDALAFENEVIDAYNYRVNELKENNAVIFMHE